MESVIGVLGVILGAVSGFYAYMQVRYAKEEVRLSKEQLDRASELYSTEDEYFNDVQEAITKINEIINKEYKTDNTISILNLGLDLETVMPWLKKLIEDSRYSDTQINYKGLIINPDYEKMIPLINGSSNISKSYVIASLESAHKISTLQVKKISLEIKQHSSLPHFHGFIINKKHLFISFTEIIRVC